MSDARELIVVGAGAAGLWAAARAARLGREVLLLEKTRRAGTKVLASGGTRCNLTTTLDAARAASLFGGAGERFLRPAFGSLPPEAVREHFAGLGVPTVEAPLEKIFPESQNARQVRDALEGACREAGVELRFECAVRGVCRGPGGDWEVELGGGERLRTPRLLLCPGGQSYAQTGTTGDGYGWLAGLGLKVVPPVPALVPLSSPERWVHGLTGIAVQDCEVKLVGPGGKGLGRRRRPLLFTHQGCSGPAAMDLSGVVARAEERARSTGAAAPGHALVIDLLPARSREDLRAQLIAAAGRPGRPYLTRALDGELPRRLIDAVCRQVDCPSNRPVGELSREKRHQLVEALKGLRLAIDGTLGFDAAEVTRGGLALKELNPRSMEVNRCPGLFVFGELLDLDGPIGGLNFQAAFATADLAARAAAVKEH